tara:strand:+ start:128 stop:508 length:381 start_codon:yes stop_codon:yes gene_type:complete
MVKKRNTKQLEAIRSVFNNAGRPLSIEEVESETLKILDSIGQRTIYRIVRRMQDLEEIAIVKVPGRADRYELASRAANHHHHFHCNICDKYFDIDGCPGGLKKLVPKGFVLTNHELVLSGICKSCK